MKYKICVKKNVNMTPELPFDIKDNHYHHNNQITKYKYGSHNLHGRNMIVIIYMDGIHYHHNKN